MITLSNFQEGMSEDMRLRDFRPRTQEAYLLVVRQFLNNVEREPQAVTDEDVRAYFLFLREERKRAPSTINIAVHGLRFFFIHTLQRDWPVFDLLRVNNPRKLPVVLGRDEVRAVLSVIRYPVRRMALTTIYALGLRLNEGLHLQTGHIDGGRLLVWVRDGKGAKNRGVPLPRPLLERLRHYWKHERPQTESTHLFVSREKRWVVYCKPTVQGADKVLQYLGRYVQRTAISDTSIIKTENGTVTFRYKCSADGQKKTMTLPAQEFLRRFLQHVPPQGFHRVRAFGLLHSKRRLLLKRLQLLLGAKNSPGHSEERAPKTKTRACPHCKVGELRILRTLSARECEVFERLLNAPPIPSVARAPPRGVCPKRQSHERPSLCSDVACPASKRTGLSI